MSKKIGMTVTVLLAAALLFTFWRWNARTSAAPEGKLIVLGVDGMDPKLMRQYMDQGKLPNLAALAARGSYVPLATSTPPQSPVAWSNLITGMNPGGHEIFDFIHRDPATMEPYLSTSRVEASSKVIHLGNWNLPLSSGKVTLLRKGKAFWEYLEEKHVPVTLFRMPANFPPVASEARTFSGMGTPDLLGTYGTFSYYTDDFLFSDGSVDGGRIHSVHMENGRFDLKLDGPYNPFRKDGAQATIDFVVHPDPVEAVARITIQGQRILLREGEWSHWTSVEFGLMPIVSSVRGMCRFYLKRVHPQFELYVSPVNIDPADPALPISTPASYSSELSEAVGRFHTLGIAEDTKALSSGILNEGEYLQQARTVMREQREIFRLELGRFHSGMLFFYFSALDQNAHMLWNRFDPQHPSYDAAEAAKYGAALEEFYRGVDEAVGEAMRRLDEHTTLLVLSDHGFAPFYRSFNLNTWLLENGYIVLKEGTTAEGPMFANVDWSRTRAYGLGLNGLYLNRSGRERDGIVPPGEVEALGREIVEKLLAFRDPGNGEAVVRRVDAAADVYPGADPSIVPDLVVGYAYGYRVGWGSVLGEFPPGLVEDNLEPWSGDHCIAPELVPGVLLSNRKIAAPAPALTDIAPTILGVFGIDKPEQMHGASVFRQTPAH